MKKGTQSEFARWIGCSRQNIAYYIRKGYIHLDGEGLINFHFGRKAFKRRNTRLQLPQTESEALKLKLLKLDVEKKWLRLDELKKHLVPSVELQDLRAKLEEVSTNAARNALSNFELVWALMDAKTDKEVRLLLNDAVSEIKEDVQRWLDQTETDTGLKNYTYSLED